MTRVEALRALLQKAEQCCPEPVGRRVLYAEADPEKVRIRFVIRELRAVLGHRKGA